MPTAAKPNARKDPRQARAKATVKAILDAAAQVLVKQGYEDATTNRVAEVAGVSIGTLYQYFPNKNALVSALAERHIGKMLEHLQVNIEGLAEAPLEEGVRQYISAMIGAHSHEPELVRVIIQQVPRIEGLAWVEQQLSQFEAMVRAYLEAHRDEIRIVDLDLAAFMLVRSVEAIVDSAIYERHRFLKGRTLADETAELVLRYLGVAPRLAARPPTAVR